jgi:predicted DNA-binding transcriptional regulator AlpA
MSENQQKSRKLLTIQEVTERVGLKKTSIYVAVGRGDFPQPVQNVAGVKRAARWFENEVEGFLEALQNQAQRGFQPIRTIEASAARRKGGAS